jgi:tetratricopeptide (TPR) repeat protein
MTNFDLPNKYMVVGDFDSAIEELEKVLQQEPRNVEAWFLLAEAHQDKKDKIRCLRQILIISPDNERARSELERLEQKQSISYDALLEGLNEPESSDVSDQRPFFDFEQDTRPVNQNNISADADTKSAGILDDDRKFVILVGTLVVLILVTVIGIF